MSELDFYNVEGIFQTHIKTKEIDEYINVLGIALKNCEYAPIPEDELKAIGENTKQVAQGLVPIRSGNLKDSINFHVTGSKNLEVYASAENMGYPYGASIEYGFHPHGGDTFVTPQPFLRPALEYASLMTQMTLKEITKQRLSPLFSGDLWSLHYGRPSFPHHKDAPWYKTHSVGIGHRMHRGQYARTTASRDTIRNNYLHYQARHNDNYGGQTQRGPYTGLGSFERRAYKQTAWGGGSKGKRG